MRLLPALRIDRCVSAAAAVATKPYLPCRSSSFLRPRSFAVVVRGRSTPPHSRRQQHSVGTPPRPLSTAALPETASAQTVMKIDDSLEPLGLEQLFDDESSTYTYLIWDPSTNDAVLVDPVDTQVDRDLRQIRRLGLKLKYGVNTHAHADHVTGTGILKTRLGSMRSVISEASEADADVHVAPGDRISFGARHVTVRATPGHTNGCVSLVSDDLRFVLTGDALLIQGCGRTDFQGGSASRLYDSVHSQLFVLPDDTVVYPAHDYKGRTSSTVGKEKTTNPRLGNTTKEEFVRIMANLKLSYPKKIDVAVPANMRCGVPDVE